MYKSLIFICFAIIGCGKILHPEKEKNDVFLVKVYERSGTATSNWLVIGDKELKTNKIDILDVLVDSNKLPLCDDSKSKEGCYRWFDGGCGIYWQLGQKFTIKAYNWRP